MVLLGARLLPGIRTPIFIMAGVLRVPFGRFLLADAIYAIPMVNVLFWLSYMLTDQVLAIFNQINAYRPLVISHLLAGVVALSALQIRLRPARLDRRAAARSQDHRQAGRGDRPCGGIGCREGDRPAISSRTETARRRSREMERPG